MEFLGPLILLAGFFYLAGKGGHGGDFLNFSDHSTKPHRKHAAVNNNLATQNLSAPTSIVAPPPDPRSLLPHIQ